MRTTPNEAPIYFPGDTFGDGPLPAPILRFCRSATGKNGECAVNAPLGTGVIPKPRCFHRGAGSRVQRSWQLATDSAWIQASSRSPAQFTRVRDLACSVRSACAGFSLGPGVIPKPGAFTSGARDLARARRSLRAMSLLIGNRSLPVLHQNYPQSANAFCQ